MPARIGALTARSVIDGVEVVDAPEERIHRAGDGVGMVATAVGIALILVLSVYAHATTEGVTTDVQDITQVLNSILQWAVEFLMSLATMIVPVVVLVSLLIYRQPRLALDGAIAAVLGFAAGFGAIILLDALGETAVVRGLSVTVDGNLTPSVSTFAVAVAALLTTVGPRSRRPILSVSWNLLWVGLATEVLTGRATLPGMVVTVLLGRLVGQCVRYVSGVTTDRASGRSLVEGIRKAGLDPTRIVRVRDISDPENPTVRLVTGTVDDDVAAPGLAPAGARLDPISDPTAVALERQGGNRVYAVYSVGASRWDAIVLDGDRQVVGALAQTWRALRLRGMDRRSVVSLRQAAERAALLNYAAAAAGVRTPQMIGIGQADDSMILLQNHPAGLRSIRDMRPAEVTDASLEEAWCQLNKAHEAGLAHRAITSDCVLFGSEGGKDQTVWLIGWDNGDVASSELARRLDITQMLATLALRVGAERAVRSAATVLDAETLASVAPLLQPIALPGATRAEAKGHKDVMDELRQALLDLLPQAALTEPFSLVRFGWRTALIALLALIAVWVVLTNINFAGIVDAVRSANPWWMAGAFGLAMTTYLGAGMAMNGFSPVRLRLRDTVLVQVAASFVALAAPGAVGPAALNLRLLYKKRVKTSVAVASVALVQISLLVTTLLLMAGVSLITGNSGVLGRVPGTAVMAVLAVLAALGALLTVPPVRQWLWLKIGPTLTQVWPRLVWILGQPRRLLLGLAGNVLQTVGYVAAFWASLEAFGQGAIPLINVTLIYLVGNAAGSAVPVPGGLGAVEIALTTGLIGAGIPTAVAAPIAVLFRALTYWARVPLGWISWRYLQKREIL
ncbi:MAG: flippase-like domain-containing protein [Bifidobacteriaceae bacterium]|nr:flippase-like domain-containing protein [Bifidobacteriaceae bacterium]